MTIDDQVRDEKLQYDINREAAKKKQALPSGKIDKCEYLLGEKILPLDQRVFSFRKSFLKTNKNK